MRARVVALALASASCAALDPTSFDAMHEQAPAVVVVGPGGATGATGFGSVLLGYGTSLPDPRSPSRLFRASRYLASSGAGGPYSVFAAFDERAIDANTTTGLTLSVTAEPRFSGCVAGALCGEGSSLSAAQTSVWHEDAAIVRRACVIVPSGRATDPRLGTFHEQVQIRCELTPSQIQSIRVPVERVGFGASVASLPAEHPLGVALFGAPGDRGGDGAIYRLDDYPLNGFTPPIDLVGPARAGIGSTLATAVLDDGSILIATQGRGRPSDPVVIVASIDPTGGVWRHACLRGRGTQFGSALAFGDFDADGIPDLAIGSGTAATDLASSQHTDLPIAIYAGHELRASSAAGCEDPPSTTLPPARSLDCPSDLAVGFACATRTTDAYAGFGAALAIGDVNADGHDDLIIGAPFATFHGGGAGALLILAGGTTFDAIGATDHSVLSYSSVGPNAHLGAAVATIPGVDRMEIVGGAPGNGRVVVFFCSGIRGDRPEDFVGRSVTHGCVLTPMAGHGVDAGPLPTDGGRVRGDAAATDASAPDAGVDAGRAVGDAALARPDANVDGG